MKMYVKVKTNFEGFHCWKNAPEKVAFLRNIHRHIFYVTLKLETFHDDREVEFFMLKNDLNDFIEKSKSNWPNIVSCEQMATDICSHVKLIYPGRSISVEVSEDNENSAIVEETI